MEAPEELKDPYSFYPFAPYPDPVSEVPVPGSLLFVLTSMAATMGLTGRKVRGSPGRGMGPAPA